MLLYRLFLLLAEVDGPGVDAEGLIMLRPIVLCARYHITPARELHFGAMTLNSRKTRTFTIENLTNKAEFKFNISVNPTDVVVSTVAAAVPAKDDKKKSVVCIGIDYFNTACIVSSVLYQCSCSPAWLVLGWVTVSQFNSQCRNYLSV